MSEFVPLKQDRSVAVRIAEQIVERLEAGEFPIGTKLPAETELARQFGVSRPSVREALGALQFVGYLESVRGSGSRVISTTRAISLSANARRDISPRSILRLFQARLLIEPQVAALAALDPRKDKLAEAQALVDGMTVVVNEPTLHGESDLRVHRAVAEICRNEFLTSAALELIDVISSPALRATRTQAWSDRVLPSLWGAQHQDIIGAIHLGDPSAAADAAWNHLVSSAHNALLVVAEDPSVDQDLIVGFQRFLAAGPLTHVFTGGNPAATPSHYSQQDGGRAHARVQRN